MFIKLRVHPDSKRAVIRKKDADSYEIWIKEPIASISSPSMYFLSRKNSKADIEKPMAICWRLPESATTLNRAT